MIPGSHNRAFPRFGHPGQQMYPSEWLANPNAIPRCDRWLRRMAEFGYFKLPA